ncbi:hypothetical protein ACVIGB_000705 [Bradyrhizobium sp. USDA 4341]
MEIGMTGLDEIKTIAGWEKARGGDRPAPFEMFFADAIVEAVVRYDEPGRFDGNWLKVRVRRSRLGNAFDLELLDAAIQGPAAEVHRERHLAGAERVPALIGTGIFRTFMKEAERLAHAEFFSAVAVIGVGHALLREALLRNGYRCFSAGSFRKIVRPLSRPRRGVCQAYPTRSQDAHCVSLV